MAAGGHLCGTGQFSGRYVYSWSLENLSKLTSSHGINARSPSLAAPDDDILEECCMTVFSTENVCEVAVFLCKITKELVPFNFLMKTYCTFESSNGKVIKTRKVLHNGLNQPKIFCVHVMPRDDLLKELEDDIVVIHLEVMYFVSTIEKLPRRTVRVLPCSELSAVCECLLPIYEAGKHSDVVISVKGTNFPAHKFMLAARSKVFAAMFENNMLERNSHRIEISDFEVYTVRQMLRFLYSGRVEEMTESIALELLRAADKYDIEDLKRFCSGYILWHVNERNVHEFSAVVAETCRFGSPEDRHFSFSE